MAPGSQLFMHYIPCLLLLLLPCSPLPAQLQAGQEEGLTQRQQAAVDAVGLEHQLPTGSGGRHLLAASQVYKAQLPTGRVFPGIHRRHLLGLGDRGLVSTPSSCAHPSCFIHPEADPG